MILCFLRIEHMLRSHVILTLSDSLRTRSTIVMLSIAKHLAKP